MIKLTLPDGTVREAEEGSCLLPLAEEVAFTYASPLMEGIFNGEPVDLQRPLYEDGTVSFVEVNSEEGMRVYTRTLLFMLLTTAHTLFPNVTLEVCNTLGSAVFLRDKSEHKLTAADIKRLQNEMFKLVANHVPLTLKMVYKRDIMEPARKLCSDDTLALLDELPDDQLLTLNYLGGVPGYLFGSLAPNCSNMPNFELIPYHDGVIINYPDVDDWTHLPAFVDQPHVNAAYQETEQWAEMIGCNTIGKLNRIITEGGTKNIIRIAEALHEKKLAGIADMVATRRKELKLILIAGPSSSGKTSTAQRLAVQMEVNGIKPVTVSMDDYYRNRVDSPRKPDGSYDFECLEAIDLELFNDHMQRLLAGERVKMPKYNFLTGMREYRGTELQLDDNSVLVIEGIHGLNEKLTASIPAYKKMKLYVSALTPMSYDQFNRVHTTDVRLLRRIVRDSQFRSHDAEATLALWDTVREGEGKYIFPFQDSADIIFNTTLIYELAVLKKYAQPLLEKVSPDSGKAYITARRLLKVLSYVKEMSDEAIPNNSIIREFVGGSTFSDVL